MHLPVHPLAKERCHRTTLGPCGTSRSLRGSRRNAKQARQAGVLAVCCVGAALALVAGVVFGGAQ